jgi:mycothiol system anti-sigma-R factor
LSAYLDEEMPAEERAHFREHIDECTPCLEELGFDQAVKAVVTKCCGGEHAPDELRAKVIARLHATSVTAEGPGFRVEQTTIEVDIPR